MIKIDFVLYDHLCQMVHFLIAGHNYYFFIGMLIRVGTVALSPGSLGREKRAW